MMTRPPFRAALTAIAAIVLTLGGGLVVADQAVAATPAHVQSRAQEQEDQGCVEKALPAKFSTVTLRYDGERFKVPKSLLQQSP